MIMSEGRPWVEGPWIPHCACDRVSDRAIEGSSARQSLSHTCLRKQNPADVGVGWGRLEVLRKGQVVLGANNCLQN